MSFTFLNLCPAKKPGGRPENKGQDLDRIARAYDTVAGEYSKEFLGEHEKKPMDREMLRRFAGEIRDKKPVWDLGCGPGQTTKYLHDLEIKISGLDLSEKTVAEARKNYPEISFRRGNMLDLDFPDSSIAGIVSFYAIVHFTRSQVETAFREIFRVLRQEGIFLLTFHIGDETIRQEEFLGKIIDVDFMLFPTEFIAGCLESAGFKEIEITEREPYPEVEYESRRAYVFARKPAH